MSKDALWAELIEECPRYWHGVTLKAPDFGAFLAQLRLSQTGKVECPYCRSYVHDQFSLSCHDIMYHFIWHHLDTRVKYVDRTPDKVRIVAVLNRLIRQPDSLSKKESLFARCNELARHRHSEKVQQARRQASEEYTPEKLPNIEIYLLRLRVTPNGQLSCRHSKCTRVTPFEASVQDIESHFAQNHCNHLLKFASPLLRSEILIDIRLGLTEHEPADLMNNLLDAAVTQGHEWNAMSTRHKRRLQSVESMRKKVQSSLYDQLLKMRQWQVLRSLRVEFNLRHRIFRRIATDSPGLQLLLKSCPRPAELLDSATLTFKDILRGDAPSSLKEIFGFINLAFSMATVIEARGIQSSFDPKKMEFDTWRQCLPDESDRLVFDEPVF